jgi:hypothetical protein
MTARRVIVLRPGFDGSNGAAQQPSLITCRASPMQLFRPTNAKQGS